MSNQKVTRYLIARSQYQARKILAGIHNDTIAGDKTLFPDMQGALRRMKFIPKDKRPKFGIFKVEF